MNGAEYFKRSRPMEWIRLEKFFGVSGEGDVGVVGVLYWPKNRSTLFRPRVYVFVCLSSLWCVFSTVKPLLVLVHLDLFCR